MIWMPSGQVYGEPLVLDEGELQGCCLAKKAVAEAKIQGMGLQPVD